ncbi:MAG: hypothetical protein D6773_02095 [Alphaproteobacteria bacterium]|nr:MAG: hypothetical protein D6773_02095 [Alphaproteobacteria bacterium]
MVLGFSAISAARAEGGSSSTELSDEALTRDKSINAPIVIAHRGASAQRPEHTLAAYQLALVQGADYIELDLVATADGELIARHENALATVELDGRGRILRDEFGRPRILEATTDVALHAGFADRLAVKQVDGRRVGGWFAEDFLASEIGELRARERLPELRPVSAVHDDRYGIPTLAEIIDLVTAWSDHSGARPGLYIELKHPTYYLHEGRRLDGRPIGTDLGAALLDQLTAASFTDPERLYPVLRSGAADHAARADEDT